MLLGDGYFRLWTQVFVCGQSQRRPVRLSHSPGRHLAAAPSVATAATARPVSASASTTVAMPAAAATAGTASATVCGDSVH